MVASLSSSTVGFDEVRLAWIEASHLVDMTHQSFLRCAIRQGNSGGSPVLIQPRASDYGADGVMVLNGVS